MIHFAPDFLAAEISLGQYRTGMEPRRRIARACIAFLPIAFPNPSGDPNASKIDDKVTMHKQYASYRLQSIHTVPIILRYRLHGRAERQT